MSRLKRSFYTRDNVLEVSRDLLGKFLVSRIDGVVTAGKITETEAYAGVDDSASHAFRGRRTGRTGVMYSIGGTSYVYLCYGIHHLFNVITNVKDVPHAVLIRSLEPVEGMESMLRRRGFKEIRHTLTRGPGSLAKAMGFRMHHNGIDLLGKEIWIEDHGVVLPDHRVSSTIRIGVENSGKDARLPYRFIIHDSPWISRTPKYTEHEQISK